VKGLIILFLLFWSQSLHTVVLLALQRRERHCFFLQLAVKWLIDLFLLFWFQSLHTVVWLERDIVFSQLAAKGLIDLFLLFWSQSLQTILSLALQTAAVSKQEADQVLCVCTSISHYVMPTQHAKFM
jgi:hypothetical protein